MSISISTSGMNFSASMQTKLNRAQSTSTLLDSMLTSSKKDRTYGLLSSSANLTSVVLGTTTGSKFLSDYASIKNGSYGKLMKSYYNEVVNGDSSETSTSSTDTQYTADATKTTAVTDLVSTLYDTTV